MRRSWPVLALLALLSAGSFAGCTQGRSMDPGFIPVPATDLRVRDLGTRDARERVGGVVVLNDNRYDELQARVEAMADPQSPSFHKFLSPEEFMERYAPSADQERTVIEALRASGFSIDRRYDNRGAIDVSAPAAVAERFFSTKIDDLVVDGQRRYGNVRPILVPAAIAPLVLGVILNDWERAHAHSARLTDRPPPALMRTTARARGHAANPLGNGPGKPLPMVSPPSPYTNAWSAYDVAQTFDFPVQSGWDGRGVTAGILIDTVVLQSDLTAYFKQLGIHRRGSIEQVRVSGAPGTSNTLEATLDTETIAGLSPGANVIVYEVPNLSFANMTDGFTYVVSKHQAAVVNSSFGACDQEDVSFDKAVQQQAVNGNAMGMSFAASSGDQGVQCYAQPYEKGVEAPASSPNVTGVGGNQSVKSLTSTAAWNTCAVPHVNHVDCSTNGGISSVWSFPHFQKGVRGSFASAKRRNVPDLAFPAYDDYIVLDGQGVWIVGTSWASPQYVSLLVQAAHACKTTFGAANVTTYAVYKKYGAGVVTRDVTKGNNSYGGVHGYRAASGYDDTTGLGLPQGSAYAAAMCGKTP